MDITQNSTAKPLLVKLGLTLLVLTNCATGFYAFTSHVKNTMLEKSVSEADEQLKSAQTENKRIQLAAKEDKSELDKAKKDANDAVAQLSTLRENIEAFAQQAASCEVVKRKLGLTS